MSIKELIAALEAAKSKNSEIRVIDDNYNDYDLRVELRGYETILVVSQNYEEEEE
jgi:hypothetical protein